MRIAFVSCLSTRVFADQPVWDWIAAREPDHVVLLGDSLYLDLASPTHPMQMGEAEFAALLYTLYAELIAQPQFVALVRALPAGHVHAIWDDHDFLWNDAAGAEVHPLHSGKLRLTTAFLEAFRAALAQRFAPGSFPTGTDDARFWDPQQPPLTTPSLRLAPSLWLHLTDGRSWRTRTWLLAEARRTLFGAAQRERFAAAIRAEPEAVHLWASGSTMAGYQRYSHDWEWLLALAARARVLALSGDIHKNNLDAFHTGGWPLHEATSSGAAVKDAVIVGRARRNFGVVDVSDDRVAIELLRQNAVELRRELDRARWLPA